MKRCTTNSRRIGLALFATAAIAASGSVFAQTVDQVLQADQRRLTLAQQSQERINQVVEQTRSLEDQYRAINKEIDGLRVYNRLMGAQTDGQKAPVTVERHGQVPRPSFMALFRNGLVKQPRVALAQLALGRRGHAQRDAPSGGYPQVPSNECGN